jgi:hypothetical protein
MKKRFTETQIIGFLKEAHAGVLVKQLCRKTRRSTVGGPSLAGCKLTAQAAEGARGGERHAQGRAPQLTREGLERFVLPASDQPAEQAQAAPDRAEG